MYASATKAAIVRSMSMIVHPIPVRTVVHVMTEWAAITVNVLLEKQDCSVTWTMLVLQTLAELPMPFVKPALSMDPTNADARLVMWETTAMKISMSARKVGERIK